MSSKPAWLPDILSLSSDWRETLKILYDIFENDFIKGKPKLDTKPVFWNRVKSDGDEYEEGFWHLIEKENKVAGERHFDSNRAEKLPWCAPSILNFNDAIIKYWDYEESRNKINIYVWLEDFDYIIIFNKRNFRIGEVAFLLTAYHVEGEATKRKLLNKYNNRIV